MATPLPEQIAGLSFGPYEIIRPLGEGGMAQVYLAVRLGVGGFTKPVVLKILHSRYLSEPHVVDMFLEEARVLSRLQHPHIVGVFEVECIANIPFLAMEYVHGPTMTDLQRHIGRPGPDTVGYLLLLVRQICDALHYAHTLSSDGRPIGLVHRDVSSQNIVIDATTGLAKLIDFGIAKAQDAPQHTEIGVLKGKVHYMAPEILAGARPDHRADIYSIGVLLYRILSGRAPFQREELFEHGTPPDLAYPSGIADIVRRATHPKREGRYDSALEVAEALQEIVDRLGIKTVHLASFVARVFPRGEEDWLQYEIAQAPTLHRSLAVLASEVTAYETVPAVSQRRSWLVLGLTLFAASFVLLTALVALYVAVLQ